MAKVISIINYKGGVGKTTVTLQLGVGLATLYNKKVLMVDLDPQCSLSLSTVDEHYWADWLERQGSVVHLIASFCEGKKVTIKPEWIIQNALDRSWDSMPGNTPGLDLLPSHLDLPDFEMRLMNMRAGFLASEKDFHLQRYLLLRDALKSVRSRYDYILFDCPPNIYLIARSAILASDFFLVPTIPDFVSCYGIPFILEHIRRMQQDLSEQGVSANARFLGILRNRVRQTGGRLVREHEEHSRQLKEEYDEFLLDNIIMDRIGVAELLSSRKNLFQNKAEKGSEIRKDFSELVKSIHERCS